jgi:hypothetical protein
MEIAQKEIDIICTKAHIKAANENLDNLSVWNTSVGIKPSPVTYKWSENKYQRGEVFLRKTRKKHTLEIDGEDYLFQHSSSFNKVAIKEGLFNSLRVSFKGNGVSGLPEPWQCSSLENGCFSLRDDWYSKNVSKPKYKDDRSDSSESVRIAKWDYHCLNREIDKDDAMSLLDLYDDVDGVATAIREAHKVLTDATDAYEVIDGKYDGNEVYKSDMKALAAQEKYLESIRDKIKQMSKDVAKLQKSFDKMETYDVYKDRVLAGREAKATKIRKAAEAKAKRKAKKRQQAQHAAFQSKMKEIKTTRKGCGCTYTINGAEYSKLCFETKSDAWDIAKKQEEPQRPYECERRMNNGTIWTSLDVWHNASV